jgi:hypothetical protein
MAAEADPFAQNLGTLNQLLGLFLPQTSRQVTEGGTSTQTTSGGGQISSGGSSSSSGGYGYEQTILSDVAVNRLLQQIMESNQGLSAVAQGQKSAGLYNTTTMGSMIKELMARAAGEVAVKGAKTEKVTPVSTQTSFNSSSPNPIPQTTVTTRPDSTVSTIRPPGLGMAAGGTAGLLGILSLLNAGDKMLGGGGLAKRGKSLWDSLFSDDTATGFANSINKFSWDTLLGEPSNYFSSLGVQNVGGSYFANVPGMNNLGLTSGFDASPAPASWSNLGGGGINQFDGNFPYNGDIGDFGYSSPASIDLFSDAVPYTDDAFGVMNAGASYSSNITDAAAISGIDLGSLPEGGAWIAEYLTDPSELASMSYNPDTNVWSTDGFTFGEDGSVFNGAGSYVGAALRLLNGDQAGAVHSAAIASIPIVGPALNIIDGMTDGSVSSFLDDASDDLPDWQMEFDPISGTINNAVDDVFDGIANGSMSDVVDGISHVDPIGGSILGGISDFVEDSCFITTAVMHSLNAEDNCYELETLRAFRDSFMRKLHPEDVERYYREAPGIVEKIKAREDSSVIFRGFFRAYIMPAITAIEQGKDEEAYEIYKNLFHFASSVAEE